MVGGSGCWKGKDWACAISARSISIHSIPTCYFFPTQDSPFHPCPLHPTPPHLPHWFTCSGREATIQWYSWKGSSLPAIVLAVATQCTAGKCFMAASAQKHHFRNPVAINERRQLITVKVSGQQTSYPGLPGIVQGYWWSACYIPQLSWGSGQPEKVMKMNTYLLHCSLVCCGPTRIYASCFAGIYLIGQRSISGPWIWWTSLLQDLPPEEWHWSRGGASKQHGVVLVGTLVKETSKSWSANEPSCPPLFLTCSKMERFWRWGAWQGCAGGAAGSVTCHIITLPQATLEPGPALPWSSPTVTPIIPMALRYAAFPGFAPAATFCRPSEGFDGRCWRRLGP